MASNGSGPARRSGSSTGGRRGRNYYQKLYQQALAIAAVLLILLIILFVGTIRACNARSARIRGADGQATLAAAATSTAGTEKAETEGADPAASSEPKGDPISLTLTVVGDCTLGTDESFDYDTSFNATYEANGADYFFANVRDIFSADDLTIANLECTFTESTDRTDNTYAFKAPAEYTKILSGSSVETVSLANNHSHDFLEGGYADTQKALADDGIIYFGNEDTAVVDVKGVKVGLVGIYSVMLREEADELVKKRIQEVKDQGAELIVAILHWGNELDQIPDESQTYLGRLAVDCGADLVCGHHAHVIQGIEVYKGKNICYGLANFCFGGNVYPTDSDSIIYQQTFTVQDGKVAVDENCRIIPIRVSSSESYNNYQPTPASGDEAARIMEKFKERCEMLDLSGEDSESFLKYYQL